ncbi:MAG TPA: hypothetical protein VGF86_12330 [Candidatus Tumulicola sp.]|jgi:hypothetical protein
MRSRFVSSNLATLCAAAALAACSGGAPSTPAANGALAYADPRGLLILDGRTLPVEHRLSSVLVDGRQSVKRRMLFVSDGSKSVVMLKNRTYKKAGEMTQDLLYSDGVWVDAKGNVYVANSTDQWGQGDSVVEYRAGSTKPKCVYTSGLFDPVNVTSDHAGNVYIADFNFFGATGYVDKYAQCSNTISTQYAITKGPEGVAVDRAGNLFVSFSGAGYGGAFEEFKGGSGPPVQLGATVASPGGLILDKNGVLITDDQETGTIDTIAPPYSSASVLASGLEVPFHCSLDVREHRLFNANVGYSYIPPSVTVYQYPSGKLLETLDSNEGITDSYGVADSPDAAF